MVFYRFCGGTTMNVIDLVENENISFEEYSSTPSGKMAEIIAIRWAL
jgi:hypothetical protein